MRYRLIGERGPTVSVVGVGGNNFGSRLDEDGTKAVVHAALDAGVTLFETADVYGGFGEGGGLRGAGERLLGAGALRQLKTKYEIAIISNTDDNLSARSVENIGVEFDHVITAQQAGAYKPDRQIFEHAFRAIGVEPSQVIHTAQGWEHDLIPTRDLGLGRRVWINRHGGPGSADYQPYDELPDLTGLPKLLGC
ncbi:aldo/keto reductase [Streptomyces collinus]|uniref:aldo/keto reductase n=1 Tax=Streptomyces collinus TaxID=42684 RepID=UPI0038090C98